MKVFQVLWKHLNSVNFVIIAFVITLFLLAKTSNNFFEWTKNNTSSTKSYNLYSDGAAYYNYLPQWFIYETGNLDFLEKINARYPGTRFDDNLNFSKHHNKKINKYYSGTAVAISPFFLMAHTVESIQSNSPDGYSVTYQIFVSIAALFYWLIGGIAIYLFLLRLKIPRFYAILTVCFITFGSNLSHYVIYEPACSHVYSFAVVSWILLLSERWVALNKVIYFYILGFLLGLAFLIRPTNLIILLFIPFLFRNFEDFYQRIKYIFTKKITSFFFFVALFSLSFIFHFWNSYEQIGDFRINTYTQEGFDYLLNPYIFEALFGIRKGIFFYAPLLLLSIFGLFYLYKLKRNLFWGFLTVFTVFTYITASWWCWWYGGGFSMRSFIDIMAVFATPLAFLLVHTNKTFKLLSVLFAFTSIYLTQIYSYQISRNILHYDNINKEDFSNVFLQTDKRFEWYPFEIFDNVPETYSVIEKTVKFKEGDNSVKEELEGLAADDDYNGLSIAVSTNSDSDDFIAGRIKGWYKIVNPNCNPFYKIVYYLKSSVKEETIYFGSKIPEVGEKKYLKLDLYPKIRAKDLDSIKIQMQWSYLEMYVRDVHFNLLKKKK